MNGRGAGVANRGTGPLQSVRLEPGVADAAKEVRSDSRNFVHYLRGSFLRPTRAHGVGYVANHFPVRTRASGSRDSGPDQLNAPLAIGEGALLFENASGGKHEMSKAGGL